MSTGARYLALAKIADGGTAEIFLAEQQGAEGFKRLVVLKRVRPSPDDNGTFRKMLLGEARLAMILRHPNLVEVLDIGESRGVSFLVMELVDGWPLAKLARRGREAGLPLPVNVVLFIVAEICRGMGYAHERTKDGHPLHIVHRDICPNNVLVSVHGEVKVTDFGIAKVGGSSLDTQQGMIRGKPAFMSPEQVRGEQLDLRSDLFSIGTVMYSLLTGTHPFPAKEPLELLRHISSTDAPAPEGVPAGVAAVVQKAMARDRKNRFQSAQQMLEAIEAQGPGSRSDLERWLRALVAKTGEKSITEAYAPAPKADEAEWISLSDEQAVVADQTSTQQAVPAFAAPSEPPPVNNVGRVVVFIAATTLTAGLGLWLQQRTPPVQVVDAVVPVVVTPVEVPDAGETATVEDAGELDVEVTGGAIALTEELDAGVEEAVDAGSAPQLAAGTSRSGTETLKLTAKLLPNQNDSKMLAVAVASEPAGVVIRVDKKALGRTPAVLRFRAGFTYDVWFEAEGQPPLRQWLMLTEKNGHPRVTLRAPVE